MIALSKDPMTLVQRRNVGLFLTIDQSKVQKAVAILKEYGIFSAPIYIGKKGEADLQGIKGGQECPWCDRPIHPLPWACEVKDHDGKQTPEQIEWEKETWCRRGGLYVLARSVEDACGKI